MQPDNRCLPLCSPRPRPWAVFPTLMKMADTQTGARSLAQSLHGVNVHFGMQRGSFRRTNTDAWPPWYVSPSLRPSVDTDIDCWITTPLPESIKSPHWIDWAGAESGSGDDRGQRGGSLKSIHGFLALCGRHCQSICFAWCETGGK